jgi:AAA+ superfamily predicted ATPase
VASTNLEDLLDDALFRRFDDVIRYRLPNKPELHDLIANRLAAFHLSEREIDELAGQAIGLSHAEICRACDEAAKMAVLDDRRAIAATDLQRSIQLRQERPRAPK